MQLRLLMTIVWPSIQLHFMAVCGHADLRGVRRSASENSRSISTSQYLQASRRQSQTLSAPDAAARWSRPSGHNALAAYYDRYVRRPIVDLVTPVEHSNGSSLLRPLHSLLSGPPSHGTSGGAHGAPTGGYSSQSTTETSIRPESRPPLFHGPVPPRRPSVSTTCRPQTSPLDRQDPSEDDLDSDEVFLGVSHTKHQLHQQQQQQQNDPIPEYDTKWPNVHRPLSALPPKKFGLYQAGPVRSTSTTTSTTRRPTEKPPKGALSGSISLGGLPTVTFGHGRPQHLIHPLPAPVAPILNGKPASVTNPYIHIGFSPEIKLLGMRIQKQFGLQLGVKIIRPQRFPNRPFSFFGPSKPSEILPIIPPYGVYPSAPIHPIPYPGTPGIVPRPHGHSDVIIGRNSRQN